MDNLVHHFWPTRNREGANTRHKTSQNMVERQTFDLQNILSLQLHCKAENWSTSATGNNTDRQNDQAFDDLQT